MRLIRRHRTYTSKARGAPSGHRTQRDTNNKEDLFFDRQSEVEDAWSRIVRERAAGESIVAAFRRDYRSTSEQRDPRSGLNDGLAAFAGVIAASPALQRREREIGQRGEAALARTLAAEIGAAEGDLAPHLVASMIAGVYRVLITACRDALLQGITADTLYPGIQASAVRAFELLDQGIQDSDSMQR